jgi:hypothetical protein
MVEYGMESPTRNDGFKIIFSLAFMDQKCHPDSLIHPNLSQRTFY